jgi:hypothetical protein
MNGNEKNERCYGFLRVQGLEDFLNSFFADDDDSNVKSTALCDFRGIVGGGQKNGASYGCVRSVEDFFFSAAAAVRVNVRSNLIVSSTITTTKIQHSSTLRQIK